MGQSLPMHSAPVPTNVRYASNSDRQPSRDRLTLCAICRHGTGGLKCRYLSGVRSRRFSGSILPGVKPFLGDLARTFAISAVEPCNPHFGATHFPMAVTNRALHHAFVLFFLVLVHRLPLLT
jgi:hypothetical protein